MKPEHLSHWGISRAPYETALEADFFFESDDHREAISRIEFLVRRPGCQLGIVTGEIGCGKSLTRSVFAERCRGRLVAQISSSHYPFPNLLRSIFVQLGVRDPGPGTSEYDLMQQFCRFVDARSVPVVLLFDEAQELDRDGMVGLRALNNLADGTLDLTIILLGQPELRRKIQALPQLDQRAGLRYHLKPLRADEVNAYLSFRLVTAGHADGAIFTRDACRRIATDSEGVPRNINRLARLAMAVSRHQSRVCVEEGDVAVVTRDLEQQRAVVVV